MDIKKAFVDFLSMNYSNNQDQVELDDHILTYLEDVLVHCDEDEFDIYELKDMCEAFLPHLAPLPKESFHAWCLSIRDQKEVVRTDDTLGNSHEVEADQLSCLSDILKQQLKVESGSQLPAGTPEQSTGLGETSEEKLSAEERMIIFEKYGLVKGKPKESVPIPHTTDQPTSNIRYLDSKVVDTKGKKYVEIKPEYPNMPQPTFLRALKRYKFH